MFDATLPFEDPPNVAVEGRAELTWRAAEGGTVLGSHFNTDPLRFLFPRTERDQPATAVLVTTSGGLVGGDRLDIRISAEPDAEGLIMTQAAEKVYRSAGPETQINVTFDTSPKSWLEWLPHETILFDGARLDRRTRLNLDDGACAIAGELLVFGRVASGERLTSGAVRDAWEVWRNGRLIWADAFRVDGDWPAVSGAVAGLGEAEALATVVAAVPDPAEARDAAREALAPHQDPGLKAGATAVNELTVVRILSDDARALRAAFASAWGALRGVSGPYGAALPRLWHM